MALLSAVGALFNGGGVPAQQVSVPTGATLSQIAAKTGVPMRDLAEANNIDDPMNFDQKKVVVPANRRLAKIIGKASRGGPKTPFSSANDLDPFGGAGFDGNLGLLRDDHNVLSAFGGVGMALIDRSQEPAPRVDIAFFERDQERRALRPKTAMGSATSPASAEFRSSDRYDNSQ